MRSGQGSGISRIEKGEGGRSSSSGGLGSGELRESTGVVGRRMKRRRRPVRTLHLCLRFGPAQPDSPRPSTLVQGGPSTVNGGLCIGPRTVDLRPSTVDA